MKTETPMARLAFEPSVRRILADLACSVIKQEDAPCSAASHFDRAITDISALIENNLEGMPADVIEVIDAAIEHMAMLGYLPPNDPPKAAPPLGEFHKHANPDGGARF